MEGLELVNLPGQKNHSPGRDWSTSTLDGRVLKIEKEQSTDQQRRRGREGAQTACVDEVSLPVRHYHKGIIIEKARAWSHLESTRLVIGSGRTHQRRKRSLDGLQPGIN